MRYRVNAPKVAADELGGEVIAINFETGNYFSLTGSAARVWAAIEGQAAVDEVVEELRGSYDTGDVDLAAVVCAFLGQLAAEGLVVGASEAPATDSDAALASVSIANRPPFEVPVLECFTDLSDLILLDPVHEVDEGLGWPYAKPDA